MIIFVHQNMTQPQVIRYLAIAEDRGLIEYSKITGLYRTTEAGLIFLDKHDEILLLLPSITDLPDVIHHSEENSVVSETITE
jgi:hypothetical protein